MHGEVTSQNKQGIQDTVVRPLKSIQLNICIAPSYSLHLGLGHPYHKIVYHFDEAFQAISQKGVLVSLQCTHSRNLLSLSCFIFSYFNSCVYLFMYGKHITQVFSLRQSNHKRVNLHLFSLQIFTMCPLCQRVSTQTQKDAALRNYL